MAKRKRAMAKDKPKRPLPMSPKAGIGKGTKYAEGGKLEKKSK